ncbi:phosphotransferase family protein [Shimia sagamensis]|uniref:Phosphotransferase enzyme family protein n=1 Tax=Shimia sagamensis TaxID=1566352 RepID=A0ABY1NEI7_9RHOB|nr:phosphotransferase [Shimia sagamensis]SMP07452.1 Phosphotransferase enzyme family protein [Shimia sagamensis]
MIAALANALPDRRLPDRWQPLFGGRTNTAWHGICEASQDVVLKLYAGPALNPLFPNDPEAEAALLHLLAPRGIAPAFLAGFDTQAGRCNLYEHLPGETWQAATAPVAQLMRHLHGVAPPSGLRRSPDGSAALLDQVSAIVSRCETGLDFLTALPRVVVEPSGRNALLHSDIVPGNLIQNADGLHLIDWQCPAIGDPCEDLAVFLSPAMQQVYRGKPLLDTEVATFLMAYGDAGVVARYRQLAPFYHARMAAYCLWQIENGRPDYAAGLQVERVAFQRSLRP